MAKVGAGLSTVGAGKSGATSRARFGPDSPWFWAGLGVLAVLLAPAMAVTIGSGLLATQWRKVRNRRMATAATAATFVAVLIAGGSIGRVWHWQWAGTAGFWFGLVGNAATPVINGVASLTGTHAPTIGAHMSPLRGFFTSLPFAVPTGLWIATLYGMWATYRRSPLTIFEGENYDWHRPPGLLDRRRAARSRRQITSGAAITPNTVSLGIGD